MKKRFIPVLVFILVFALFSHMTLAQSLVEINNIDKKTVMDKIVSDMVSGGYQIATVSDYHIMFRQDVKDEAAKFLYGSDFNNTPELRITFSVVQAGQNVKVSYDGKIVSNPGSAYEKLKDITDNPTLQTYLTSLKQYFDGFVGYGLGIVPEKKNKCFEIASISKGSSAEAEGLAVGDLISEINGGSTSAMRYNKFMELLVSGGEGTQVELKTQNAAGVRTVKLTKTFVPPIYQRGN